MEDNTYSFSTQNWSKGYVVVNKKTNERERFLSGNIDELCRYFSVLNMYGSHPTTQFKIFEVRYRGNVTIVSFGRRGTSDEYIKQIQATEVELGNEVDNFVCILDNNHNLKVVVIDGKVKWFVERCSVGGSGLCYNIYSYEFDPAIPPKIYGKVQPCGKHPQSYIKFICSHRHMLCEECLVREHQECTHSFIGNAFETASKFVERISSVSPNSKFISDLATLNYHINIFDEREFMK